MTRKDTERLVREQMQQALPDKDALWAKIEQNLGEQKPPAAKPSIRMQTVYRVMGAAACLLLILGGVGVFAAVSGHNLLDKSEQFTAENAVMEQADDAAPAMEQDADEAADEEMDAAGEPDRGFTSADSAKQAAPAADAAQNADDTASYGTAAENSSDSPLNSETAADAARNWLTEYAAEMIPTITNWSAPEITQVDALPADYAAITDEHAPAPYWRVRFTTTQDAVLGTEDVYVDANGVVLALSLRE